MRKAMITGFALIASALLLSGWDATYWVYVTALAMTFAILAISLNLVMGYTGLVSVAHGALFGIGVYGFVLSSEQGVPPVLAGFFGIGCSCLGGLVLGVLTLRLSGHYFAISSMAFAVVVALVLERAASFTHGARGLTEIPAAPVLDIVGLHLDFASPGTALVGVTVILVVCQMGVSALIASPFGRALTAIRSSELLASSFGVRVVRTKLLTLVLSSAIAGLAGILYVLQVRFFSPADASFTVGFYAVMYVVVGGLATVWGPVIGALTLRVLPEYLRAFDELRLLLLGLLLIVVIQFVPRGIVGIVENAWHYLRKRRRGQRVAVVPAVNLGEQ